MPDSFSDTIQFDTSQLMTVTTADYAMLSKVITEEQANEPADNETDSVAEDIEVTEIGAETAVSNILGDEDIDTDAMDTDAPIVRRVSIASLQAITAPLSCETQQEYCAAAKVKNAEQDTTSVIAVSTQQETKEDEEDVIDTSSDTEIDTVLYDESEQIDSYRRGKALLTPNILLALSKQPAPQNIENAPDAPRRDLTSLSEKEGSDSPSDSKIAPAAPQVANFENEQQAVIAEADNSVTVTEVKKRVEPSSEKNTVEAPDDDTDVFEVEPTTTEAGMSYATAPVVQRFQHINNIHYPCVMIEVGEDGALKHQTDSLKLLVSARAVSLVYPLYLYVNNTLANIGSIDAKSLRTLLTSPIFKSWEISVLTSQTQAYTGDMRLAFCAYT